MNNAVTKSSYTKLHSLQYDHHNHPIFIYKNQNSLQYLASYHDWSLFHFQQPYSIRLVIHNYKYNEFVINTKLIVFPFQSLSSICISYLNSFYD